LQGKEHNYFELLKKKIVAAMQESYPGINPSIAEWKGQEIIDFQEELRIRVNANISEKWFYTHMKATGNKLPRIDMLNLLSKYAGYLNWDDFVFRNRHQAQDVPAAITVSRLNPNSYFYFIPVLVIVIVGIFFGLFKLFNTRDYRFIFVDADTRDTITGTQTEVILFREGESPIHQEVAANGSFSLRTDNSKIRMVVKAPYYRTDTIVRIVTKLGREETVLLKPDDYALMIHYFSTMNVDDWEKRRERLDSIFDDAATICQVFKGREARGMALFSKSEFIDRMTMPTGNLKNIEILDSKSRNGKILVLRFCINDNQK
jgi:hypothetical protein